MKKRLLSLLLVFAMLLGLTACGGTANEAAEEPVVEETAEAPAETEAQPAEEARADFVFTDDCGREVTIPGDVSSIVPSGPLAQIILYAIAPEMIVGLASEYGSTADGIIPEEHQNLPYFGQLYNTANLNMEELAAAGPQLIIDIGRPMDDGAEDLDNLQAATQIPSVFVSASLETMPETFRTLGVILNKEEKAEELALFCERVYGRTISIMEQVGDNKVDALYVLGEEGLSVLAKDSYHSEMIDLLTNNVAVVDTPSSKGSGNEVTMEQIALWNPEFILFASDSIYDTAAELPTWDQMQAITSGNYIEVPEGPHNWMGTPPAVQRYLGMIWLTAELYPEYCDYDVKAEILEYYELFYDCQLTDEQYNALTANAFLE